MVTIMNEALYFSHSRKLYRIALSDILYAEANKAYTHIITKKKLFRFKINLHIAEQSLPSERFDGIHRSYIVSMPAIASLTKSEVFMKPHRGYLANHHHVDLITGN